LARGGLILLAGDVGGTKTNLGVFSSEKGPRAPIAESTFPNGDYLSLETLVGDFLARLDVKVERAAFGVAGPALAGWVKATNLPWVIDEKKLKAELKLSDVVLMNDLEAIAHAVPFLESTDLHTLNEGKPVHGGAIGIIAPGTGLGEAFLCWNGSRYRSYSSEGGHADFAPTRLLEIDLLHFLQKRFGHVSYERVCSGLGLPNIYAYLKESGRADEPDWLAEQLAGVDDPTPVIINSALDPEEVCELCVATLEMFVSILGAEAGNLALKVLATGGVYLGGGIPPRILPALEHERFMNAFRGKGRLSELLAAIPVDVILNPKAALFGAARRGLEA